MTCVAQPDCLGEQGGMHESHDWAIKKSGSMRSPWNHNIGLLGGENPQVYAVRH
jgi:hypothetical protein